SGASRPAFSSAATSRTGSGLPECHSTAITSASSGPSVDPAPLCSATWPPRKYPARHQLDRLRSCSTTIASSIDFRSYTAHGQPARPRHRRPALATSTRRGPVLRDVGLQAHPGQIVAVPGENGSGKTPLLRICAGLETADTGTVHRRAAAGYCPQEPALFDLLTPAEHLALFA